MRQLLGSTRWDLLCKTDKEDMVKVKNEKNVILNEIVSGERAKFTYIFDFGDFWQYKILIEKSLPLEPDTQCPICIKGKRASPPEDCGGPGGYFEIRRVLQYPNHPEHNEMLKWIGGSFDSEAFNLDEINQELKKLR